MRLLVRMMEEKSAPRKFVCTCADSCDAANRPSFDHVVGAAEQLRRQFKARRFGGLERTSSSRFAPRLAPIKVTPVTLFPGRLRLVTRPALTGSNATTNTIGTDVVAILPRAPPEARELRLDLRDGSQDRQPWWGSRLYSASAMRTSIMTSLPTTKPIPFKP